MIKNERDISLDMDSVEDRGESPGLLEPLLISANSSHISTFHDLAIDLAAKSAGFKKSLPPTIVTALAKLVRGMNCYYSNLIEGHDTHPVDIERALQNDYSSDTKKRNLQLEAKAHIEVQLWIEQGGIDTSLTTANSLVEIHKKFCSSLPEELLWAHDKQRNRRIKILPGALRKCDVQVGRHIPVSPGAIPRFLRRFEQAYSNLGRADLIIASPAAHHRLLWIHPFLDGNGRVVRLLSHAMLQQTLITGGMWSISRGLARNEQQYKSLLNNCDQQRRNDLDGRGNLSEEALVEFTYFFLELCLDQISFMENLVQPQRLNERIINWTTRQTELGRLQQRSSKLMEVILYKGGKLSRSEPASILDVGDRQARRVVSDLIKEGVLTSESTRAPLLLNFPARLAEAWMPGLFPSQV